MSIGFRARNKSIQLNLFQVPPQTRRKSPEAPDLYAAVVALRRNGLTVYAAGDSHKVDGRLLSSRDLIRLAGRLGGVGR